jgi:molecular chaperone DnaK
MTAPAVGIDLGTTNSVVAVSLGGRPQILTDTDGAALIPSMVSFREEGGFVVGREARKRRTLDPANTVYSVKRLLGRPFKSEEVKRAISRMPFTLREGRDSAVVVATRAGELTLPELSAMVLREVRRVAEQALGAKVERCVVTVPANFNELQRSSTKIAGKVADLEVVRILNEPTAAALAYGYGRGTREKICIYDFGGGTFDVTLLELSGNVFEVLATAGDTFLGGDDVDIALADALVPQFQRATRIDPMHERVLYDVLRDAAEGAKCTLSTVESAPVRVDFNLRGQRVQFEHTLSRPDLERVANPFINRTFDVCAEALKLAGLRASDLTAVILVGGSTRIPSVRARVASFFGRDPMTHLPPEEVVALGASILAEALTASRRGPTTRAHGADGGDLSSPNLRPGMVGVGVPAVATAGGPPPGRPSNDRNTLTGVTQGAPRTAPQGPPPLVTAGPNATTARPPPPPPGALGPKPPSAPTAPGERTVSVASAGLDLDDPFAPGAGRTATLQTGAHGATLPGGINPLRGNTYRALQAQSGGLSQLDEPTTAHNLEDFAQRPTAPAASPAFAPPVPPSAPSFQLDDPSVVASMPSEEPGGATVAMAVPPPRPVLGAAPMRPGLAGVPSPEPPAAAPPVGRPAPSHGLPAALASVLPPSIAAAITAPPPPSSPDSRFARAVAATMPSAERNDASMSFRVEADVVVDAFGSVPDEFGAPPQAQPVSTPPPSMPSGVKTQTLGAVPAPPLGGGTMKPGGAPPAPAPFELPPSLPPARGLGPAPQALSHSPGPMGRPSHAGLPAVSANLPAVGASLPAPAAGLPAPLLVDVTPLSLGVETTGGMCEPVIERNATIPTEKSRVFATTQNNQTSVLIRIAQGESRKFSEISSWASLSSSACGPRRGARWPSPSPSSWRPTALSWRAPETQRRAPSRRCA